MRMINSFSFSTKFNEGVWSGCQRSWFQRPYIQFAVWWKSSCQTRQTFFYLHQDKVKSQQAKSVCTGIIPKKIIFTSTPLWINNKFNVILLIAYPWINLCKVVWWWHMVRCLSSSSLSMHWLAFLPNTPTFLQGLLVEGFFLNLGKATSCNIKDRLQFILRHH